MSYRTSVHSVETECLTMPLLTLWRQNILRCLCSQCGGRMSYHASAQSVKVDCFTSHLSQLTKFKCDIDSMYHDSYKLTCKITL